VETEIPEAVHRGSNAYADLWIEFFFIQVNLFNDIFYCTDVDDNQSFWSRELLRSSMLTSRFVGDPLSTPEKENISLVQSR
jgi:hypothetical protein